MAADTERESVDNHLAVIMHLNQCSICCYLLKDCRQAANRLASLVKPKSHPLCEDIGGELNDRLLQT